MFFHGRVKIFDSAEVVARKLTGILQKESLLCTSSVSKNEFFVSDYTRAFEAATKIFFKKEIHLELCRL
jgi:glutamate racemase